MQQVANLYYLMGRLGSIPRRSAMVVEVLMDTCRFVIPELPDRYRSITPWGRRPKAESGDLKSSQCGFESRRPYQFFSIKFVFRVYKLSTA